MKRKIYNKLLEWKERRNGATAVLVEGARRVGKSYIVEEFARTEYDSYLLIDFNKADMQQANTNSIFTVTPAVTMQANVWR